MMNENYTLSDIAAATGNCRSNGNGNGMFSGDGAWWIIILLLFGWGGRGFGSGFGGGSGGGSSTCCGSPCATQADVRAAVDQQTLISKLDQQTYGLADATYALNNAITGGFANAELSRCNQQAVLMGQLYNMSADSAKCCCETQRLLERGFADTNYNIATQACDTRNTIQNTTRDIIDNQNCNARAILDALTAQRIEAKDEKIASQQQTIFGLQLAASQAAQNNYLINQLRTPCPVPAYVVPNPNCCYQNTTYANNGCGGCNGFAA